MGEPPAKLQKTMNAAQGDAFDKQSSVPDAKEASKEKHDAEPLQYGLRTLRRDLKNLGTVTSLQNPKAIPEFADKIREGYLELLSGDSIFKLFGDSFLAAKGVAHR